MTEKSYNIGLATSERFYHWKEKKAAIEEIENFCHNYSVKATYINKGLRELGSTELQRGCKLFDLISRPGLSLYNLSNYIPSLKEKMETVPNRKEEIIEAAEIRMKYSGYITRERELADKMIRLENIKIKGKFDYNSLQSLSTEARQKLTRINPETMAQASRIPGVSPSDINVLLVLMRR